MKFCEIFVKNYATKSSLPRTRDSVGQLRDSRDCPGESGMIGNPNRPFLV